MNRGPGRGLLVIALLVVAGLLAGCGIAKQDQAGAELEVAAVERGSLTSSITAVGTVRAGSEVVLSFEASGRM